jgi:predicted nucleotide-binding protein
MRKSQEFPNVRFTPEVLRAAIEVLQRFADAAKQKLSFQDLDIEHDDAKWSHDSPEEFFADYRKFSNTAHLVLRGGTFGFNVWAWPYRTDISVNATTRAEIESVFAILEAGKATCQLPVAAKPPTAPVVFIGHGRSAQWRDLKDHLLEKHGYRVEAYETGARAGHTIRDILEDMVRKSSFAVLVLTAEDEQADGQYRARQNVIHEAGLFQGRLGFARAIMLLEENVEEFSNVQGVQYIRFSKNNIKETFGEVLATLRREFGGDA